MNRYEYVRGLVPCEIGISPPPIIPQTQTKPFKGVQGEIYRVGFVYDQEDNIFVGLPGTVTGLNFSSVIAVFYCQSVGEYDIELYTWIFGQAIYEKLYHRLSIKPYRGSKGFYFKGDHRDFELTCMSDRFQTFEVVGHHDRNMWEIALGDIAEVKPLLDSRLQLLNM